MQFQNNKEKVLIIDFGSQVTKLIARRVRDLGVYSEVVTSKELKNILNPETYIGLAVKQAQLIIEDIENKRTK